MILSYKQHKSEIEKRIRNLESLPTGLKCNFLLAIKGEDDTLIAKQWKRVEPKSLASNEILIKF